MSISAANLGGVADPRLGGDADLIGTGDERRGSVTHGIPPPELHGHRSIYMDESITFEDYHFWANRSREYEKHIEVGNLGLAGIGKLLVGKKQTVDVQPIAIAPPEKSSLSEKGGLGSPSDSNEKIDRYGVTESEWEIAQRATRTATWGSVFYLITTDILGPFNVPWAISQMGYGPGAALYTVFGGMAFYSGLQLWKIFIGLDSTRYPMRNYGDVAFRVFGKYARLVVNVLQSFQFLLNVTLLIESNGQGLAQMAAGANGNGFLCFVVAEVIFMICGMVLGQIRTLQRLSFLANIAIWLNVIVIITT
jgi:hypothetical protein